MEAQGRPAAPARGIDINSRRPGLSQVSANPHHVPCASSACRTRMPPPPPQGGPGAGGPRGEQQGTDWTTTTRVRGTAGVTATSPPHFFPSSAPLYSPVVVVLKRLRLVDSRQRHFFLLPRHRMPACVPLSRHRQSSNLRACTSNSCAIRLSKRSYISTCGPSSFSHMCLSRPFSISMRYTS